MARCCNDIVYAIENKYGVQAIASKEKGLFYLQDDDREAMGIMTVIEGNPLYTILKKKQIKALINELQDVYDMMFN